MPPLTLDVDGLRLSRVLYADVLIPPEPAGLTVDDIAAVPWREPTWGVGEQIGASASAWIVESNGRRLVLDPLQAADEVLHDPAAEAAHQSAVAEQFERDGFARESIDTVVISHIETIGLAGERNEAGEWTPFFPNAQIVISQAARDLFDREPGDTLASKVWRQFIDGGQVDTFADGAELVPGMRCEVTGVHNPGHTVFHFGPGPDVTWLGHLAVSPLHLATGLCPAQHPEPERAWELLRGFVDDGRTLIAPLWPSPGCGRWSGATFVPGP